MKQSAIDNLETEVRDALGAMLTIYRELNDLALQMEVKQDQGKSIVSDMEILQKQREKLDEINRNTVESREKYRQSRKTASKAVQQLSAQTSQQLEQLIEKVGRLESSARDSYQRLLPEIAINVRGNQMKSAYQNTAMRSGR